MDNEATNALIEKIPDPEDIHRRLSELYREADILRRLLRLAEQKAKAKQRGAE